MTSALRRADTWRTTDEGFTLVELLVVMVVLPLILGGIAAMLVALLQNSTLKDPHGVATRLSDSHDAEIASSYFTRDVQGASYVTTSASPVCVPTAPGSQLLGLQWSSGSTTNNVSYFVQTSPLQLVRYYCNSSGAATTSVIADNIFTTLTPTTSVTIGDCGSSRCVTGNGNGITFLTLTVACFNGNCPPSLSSLPGMPVHPSSSSGAGVASIRILGHEGNSGYNFALTGIPRATNPSTSYAKTNVGQSPALIVNGTVSGGNCTIAVNGTAAVDSTSDRSIATGPNGSITASGELFTSDPNPAGSTSGNVSPTPVYATPASSQYSNQNEPPSAPTSAGYASVQVNTQDWDPSTDTNYESGGVLNATQYPHGVIFDVTNGMKITKAFSAPQGVLFYVSGGNISLAGNGTLFLNPLSPSFEAPTQPTPEIVVWMAGADHGTLTLGGNGNTTAINGAIYAPNASTTLNGGGNHGGLSVGTLDVSNVNCNGSGSISVGAGSASTTTVTPSSPSVSAGSGITASVVIQGSGSLTPSGSVSVYQCGPSASSAGCGQTSGWTPTSSDQVGSATTSFTSTGSGGARMTSASFVPTASGTYCFAAYYTGSNYSSSSDTTADGCFNVTVASPVVSISQPSLTCYDHNGNGPCSTSWPGSISGTASDNGGPGLKSVQMTIEDTTSSKYWDTTNNSFDLNTATSFTLSGSLSNWTYTFNDSNFTSGHSYSISVTAYDTSNNASSPASASFKIGN